MPLQHRFLEISECGTVDVNGVFELVSTVDSDTETGTEEEKRHKRTSSRPIAFEYKLSSIQSGREYAIFPTRLPSLNQTEPVWVIARIDVRNVIIFYYSPYETINPYPPGKPSAWKEIAGLSPGPKISFSSTKEDDNESKMSVNENTSKPILVAGGAGFIGSHTVVELCNAGFKNIVIVDNFVNSSPEAVKRVEKITGLQITVYNVDISTDVKALDSICAKHHFYCCIHFASLKAVGESVKKPLLYYRNNLVSTMNLVEALNKYHCYNFIFSSSATVYGDAKSPITEVTPIGHMTNPYGKTKYFIEQMLTDYAKANANWRVVLLRYFNPIGSHSSGLIGEDPNDIPNNLMPYLAQVAVERRPHLNIWGNDYDTVDGTGVRDYVHVVDLAIGHVAALSHIVDMNAVNLPKAGRRPSQSILPSSDKDISAKSLQSRVRIYNLGTGKGTSVLELLTALEKAADKKIPYKICARREGDIATVYADPSLAEKELKWKSTRTIEDMCVDQWRWQSTNPMGYRSESK